MQLLRYCALAALCAVLGACATTNVKVATSTPVEWTLQNKRVVLVEPDVELGSMEASGMVTPRADWTATAKGFIKDDIRSTLSGRDIDLALADTTADHHETQLVKLHGAVGTAVLLHLYFGGLKLPNKGDALDWTLGPGVNTLRDHYNGDYALFVYVRDSYTSAGRALVMLGAAVLGVGVTGGQQTGFASLVDLRTGKIVWFNRLINMSGDLRTAKPAADTVKNLLQGMPL